MESPLPRSEISFIPLNSMQVHQELAMFSGLRVQGEQRDSGFPTVANIIPLLFHVGFFGG